MKAKTSGSRVKFYIHVPTGVSGGKFGNSLVRKRGEKIVRRFPSPVPPSLAVHVYHQHPWELHSDIICS